MIVLAIALGAYAVQVNANGKVDWEVKQVFGPKPENIVNAVASLPDGGVIVVGSFAYTAPAFAWTDYNGALAEIDATGVVTLKYQGTPTQNTTWEYYNSVALAPAGGYWIGGRLTEVGGGSTPWAPDTTPVLVRSQANGSAIFSKVFGKIAPGKYQTLNKLIADADGVTVFGRSDFGPYGKNDAWVARVDNNNKLIYERHFGGAGEDGFDDAVAAPEGGFLVAGNSTLIGEQTYRALIGRVSADGLLTWQRNFAELDSNWRGIALTPTGMIALAGRTNFKTAGENDFLTATCDTFGNCTCATSGTCLTKKLADFDDKNPCSLDWCEAGVLKQAIGNEGLSCGDAKTCVKGKCQ